MMRGVGGVRKSEHNVVYSYADAYIYIYIYTRIIK